MTPEAERAVDEVAAARKQLDAHYEQIQATTRQLNQDLRQEAITAINVHGASKYAVARAARRSRTTVYQWLKAGESSGAQERVVADSVVRREAGESSGAQERVVADSVVRREAGKEWSGAQERVVADSVVRREAGKEWSGAQERVVADSVVRVSVDRARQDEFVACAMALVDRFDDPSMTSGEKKELLETTARALGVRIREMTTAVTLARNVKRGLWETCSDT